ncbi:hypothetical protein [Chondrinema litorale]|uniref:hypothetical protein n=1 Tax=Chondrinema litorale TaxID=2994555 RepID=UPI0025433888|nr:hypothetical protein [Chondrinema litorale]UZS00251.1 hypothetical protein OQ292_40635 [Chondrinema litorale]
MKKIILTALISLFSLISYSQHISETLINLKREYNPLFKNEAAALAFTFLKNYDVNGSDTSYVFTIEVFNRKTVLENFAVGAGFLSNYFGSSVAGNYSFNDDYGIVLMDKAKFDDFVNGINKVYVFANSAKTFMKASNNMVATYKIDQLTVGSEYRPDKLAENKLVFYLQIGKENSFQFSQVEFEELFKTIKEVNKIWGKV